MDQQTKDPDVLNVLVLERVDRTKNMARYYVLSVEPTLFAESSLVRRWGRIGGAGRTRIDLYASPPLAQIALNTWLERKRRANSFRMKNKGRCRGKQTGAPLARKPFQWASEQSQDGEPPRNS
jgi:predicted DNA-binding WGR domain protein